MLAPPAPPASGAGRLRRAPSAPARVAAAAARPGPPPPSPPPAASAAALVPAAVPLSRELRGRGPASVEQELPLPTPLEGAADDTRLGNPLARAAPRRVRPSGAPLAHARHRRHHRPRPRPFLPSCA